MRNSCLQQSPPAAASTGALPLKAGVSVESVAHFRALGSPLGPSGAAGRAGVPARAGFLAEDIGEESPLGLALLALVAGRGCPASRPGLRAFGAGSGLDLPDPRRARTPAAAEARPWLAPTEWGGLLQGEGMESTWGDGAPKGGFV